jgi:hypothetical protein
MGELMQTMQAKKRSDAATATRKTPPGVQSGCQAVKTATRFQVSRMKTNIQLQSI